MSLISLLLALAAEKFLSSPYWQFKTYYHGYIAALKKSKLFSSITDSAAASILIVFLPVFACSFILDMIDDSLIQLVLSTLILISCFGCIKTRDSYKRYLQAAFRGEQTSCDLIHQQLQQDKNAMPITFGQLLVWLNYRYFIAIMIFFVIFGAPGALFYRLLTTVNERLPVDESDPADASMKEVESKEASFENEVESKYLLNTELTKRLLFWADWLPVRLVAFGYMLVGHFSNALPVWLEKFFDVAKQPQEVLIAVAKKSEDINIEQDDCTAEPCTLVKLAKRTLLLCLAVVSMLILTGVLD